MLGFEEARRIILGHVAALGPEVVPAVESVGRVLCAPLVAPWDLPLWNNSAMDGYAVRAEDCTGRVALKVT
ncbi:MAG TPA: molybdopterin molybdenumtransferase MoeA, partial [Anaeromyxobacteraceae bacterium]|nr:molybdopterin molybdenumtransferase MoeA [Anaeromyxobacteraceae bacterium]